MLKFRNFWVCYSAIVSIFLFSCQSEITQEVYNTQETILKTTPLTAYLERMAMENTTQDDVVDGARCFRVKFPYSLIVNSTKITLKTKSDFQVVANIKNMNMWDDDIVHFQFPITIIYSDYSEKIISNQTDLFNELNYCAGHKDDFLQLNCLSFNFPLKINIYDSYKQLGSSVNLLDNKSLYNFIHSLSGTQLISLEYPLTVKDENNQVTTISDNSQLEDRVMEALGHCSDNNHAPADFIQTLLTGNWKIGYFYEEAERTSLYNGFIFNFKNDHTVIATKSGVNYFGQWESKIENGVNQFKMNFSSDPLHDLEKDWKLFEFNSSQIRFREGLNHSGLESDYLYFFKIN